MNEIVRLLTIEEVATILRVHTRTVTRYIESGRLKASKLGVWRIKQSSLDGSGRHNHWPYYSIFAGQGFKGN